MKNYKRFIRDIILEKLDSYQEEVIDKIIDYLNLNTDVEFFKYHEEFIVKKDNKILESKLFLMGDSRALRINFDNDILHSLDLWQLFTFNVVNKDNRLMDKPYYTMIPVTKDVDLYLDDIVDFVNDDFTINERLVQNETKFKKAEDEDVELKSITISRSVLNENIDIFDAMNMYCRQVIYGVSNSLIISGGAGLGKSYEVESILKESRTEHQFIKGDISTAGLYQTLFVNNGELIVFDDCDAVWGNTESNNLLKAALDTKKVRSISRIINTHFDSKGMTYKQMLDKYNETGKLPKQFDFTGRCIFITNVDGKNIDPAVVNRSLHVDIDLTKEQVIGRLRNIVDNLFDKITEKAKEETLDFVDYMTTQYPTKFPLSIRTMIHAMNIRMANEGLTVTIKGERVPAWQMLIKEFLVKK